MKNSNYTKAEAYDRARKEFYKLREAQEIQQRVAREEALHYGAKFGRTALDVGMQLEDAEYERWKVWAKEEVEYARQVQQSAYTGMEAEDAVLEASQSEESVSDEADEGTTNEHLPKSATS